MNDPKKGLQMTENSYVESEKKILTHVLDELVACGKTKYDPIYICGAPKDTSPVISDFVSRYIRAFPDAVIKLYTGESFPADILTRIKNGEQLSAKLHFGDTDLLIVENVDLVSGKTVTMEKLFSAFDIVEERGGQIIFTAEKLPCETDGLELRNRAQFEGGLIININ